MSHINAQFREHSKRHVRFLVAFRSTSFRSAWLKRSAQVCGLGRSAEVSVRPNVRLAACGIRGRTHPRHTWYSRRDSVRSVSLSVLPASVLVSMRALARAEATVILTIVPGMRLRDRLTKRQAEIHCGVHRERNKDWEHASGGSVVKRTDVAPSQHRD